MLTQRQEKQQQELKTKQKTHLIMLINDIMSINIQVQNRGLTPAENSSATLREPTDFTQSEKELPKKGRKVRN